MEIGYVVNVSMPKPKYAVPPTFGQVQDMVVDVTAKVDGQIVNYTMLPANQDVADTYSNNENIVITDNREAMNAEIISTKQKSIDILNSIETHKNTISDCDKILSELNPEYAEKQQQQSEINSLKSQLMDVTTTLSSLTQLIKELKEEKK
ncbi:MAG: hypothetical protein Q4C49_00075 [Bacillota bacterium]|nr:hypothetical protein [Bacillota bacterium]